MTIVLLSIWTNIFCGFESELRERPKLSGKEAQEHEMRRKEVLWRRGILKNLWVKRKNREDTDGTVWVVDKDNCAGCASDGCDPDTRPCTCWTPMCAEKSWTFNHSDWSIIGVYFVFLCYSFLFWLLNGSCFFWKFLFFSFSIIHLRRNTIVSKGCWEWLETQCIILGSIAKMFEFIWC